MIIADIEYTEDIEQASNLHGGRRRSRGRGQQNSNGNSSLFSFLQPFLQSLSINPAASATVANLGGDSIGNTAISTNISMPIFIIINQHGDGSFSW